jgi:hypothetical protein
MKRHISLLVSCLLALCSFVSAQDASSQEGADTEAAELAKTVQNPLASLVSLPFQTNYNRGVGEYERTFFNMNIQPVIPYSFGNLNVITRTIIPLNSAPIGETDSVFGVGDVNASMFFSPASDGALTWGVGPAMTLPSASNTEVLGSGKLSLGPTGVVFLGLGKWTMGGVASNSWSVAGASDREDVNFFFAQWFLNFNLGKGWAIGTAPIITGNWEADPDNRWVIPWGVQISKVTHFGSRPANIIIGYYKNSTHPEGGADSQIRFQINLLYPQMPKSRP